MRTKTKTAIEKRFFSSITARTQILEDLGCGRIHYKDLPLQLKFRRAILMHADIRDILQYAPLSAYRSEFCVEGMIRNLLETEKNFFSIYEYVKLIDNMRKAVAEKEVWDTAREWISKSKYERVILGYLYNGKLRI